jgi:hypothetical protein
MSWNHRVVFNETDRTYEIMEVYYNKEGDPVGYCDASAFVGCEDFPLNMVDMKIRLKAQLKQMKQALKLPVLSLPSGFQNGGLNE